MFAEMIPDALVRLFARPYVAGDSLEHAMQVAAELVARAGLVTTLDLLAEEVKSKERVQDNLEMYRQMIRAAGTDSRIPSPRMRPTVSVKLSSFTLSPLNKGGNAEGSAQAAEELAQFAKPLRVPLTLDMEDRSWTDFTLTLALRLFQHGYDVGTVLQSRLHRTQEDILRIPQGMRIRTVIGIYPEPPEYALTAKPQMKDRLLQQSKVLLERGAYVELASHDEQYLHRFFAEIIRPSHVSGERYEIQMLYGVPRGNILAQIARGRMCEPGVPPPLARLYVPFATDWDQATAYCRRRLRNNPGLATYVLRNLASSLLGARPGIRQYVVPESSNHTPS